MKATILPTSMALPPPKAMMPSWPPSRKARVPASTLLPRGFGRTSENRPVGIPSAALASAGRLARFVRSTAGVRWAGGQGGSQRRTELKCAAVLVSVAVEEHAALVRAELHDRARVKRRLKRRVKPERRRANTADAAARLARAGAREHRDHAAERIDVAYAAVAERRDGQGDAVRGDGGRAVVVSIDGVESHQLAVARVDVLEGVVGVPHMLRVALLVVVDIVTPR